MADKNIPNWPDESLDPFAEYYISGEPGSAEKAYAWQTAIGLQDVDRISPSEYLIKTAKNSIEGEISLDEAKKLVDTYYEENETKLPDRTEEADKVSVRIAEILSENTFTFSPAQYVLIHKRLFAGIYSHAGKIRDYDISKKEWVLNGDSVLYGGAADLRATLDYDFQSEQEFNYANLNMSEIIHHLARFISRLWQIHLFGEGNTRTTAVFFIKYLRSLGFRVTNDTFAKNAWYFRNALVRANYNDLRHGIHEDLSYLEVFLRNLLLGEKHDLKNRYLHVNWKKTAHSDQKQHIEQHIEEENSFSAYLDRQTVTKKTKHHIFVLREAFGKEKIFGRGDVVKILPITERPASTLLSKMYSLGVTEKVTGVGKGKYRFIM